MRYWLTRGTMAMPWLTAFGSVVRGGSFHPGAIVWCSEVMIDICIRSAIWSSGFLIGSSNSEESQLVMKSWRVTTCRSSLWFVLLSGLLDFYRSLGTVVAFSLDEARAGLVVEMGRPPRRRFGLLPATEAVRKTVMQEFEVSLHAVRFVAPGSVPVTSSGKIRRKETQHR